MIKLLNYIPDISLLFVICFIWIFQPANTLLFIPIGLGVLLFFKNMMFNKVVLVLKKTGNYYKIKQCPAMKVIKKNKETKNVETYLSIAGFKEDKPYPNEENVLILEKSILSPFYGEAILAYGNNEDLNIAKGELKESVFEVSEYSKSNFFDTRGKVFEAIHNKNKLNDFIKAIAPYIIMACLAIVVLYSVDQIGMYTNEIGKTVTELLKAIGESSSDIVSQGQQVSGELNIPGV